MMAGQGAKHGGTLIVTKKHHLHDWERKLNQMVSLTLLAASSLRVFKSLHMIIHIKILLTEVSLLIFNDLGKMCFTHGLATNSN